MGKTKELKPEIQKIKEAELAKLQGFNQQITKLKSQLVELELAKQEVLGAIYQVSKESNDFTKFISNSYALTQNNVIDISTGEIKVVEKDELNP